MVGQEGYGPSLIPRIRYSALEECFRRVAEQARELSATIHMPRIGAGESGGSWDTVEDIIRNSLGAAGLHVTVYDLPPKRAESAAELLF